MGRSHGKELASGHAACSLHNQGPVVSAADLIPSLRGKRQGNRVTPPEQPVLSRAPSTPCPACGELMTIDAAAGRSQCNRCPHSEPLRAEVASRLLGYLAQLSAREAEAVPAAKLLDLLNVPLAVVGSVLALGLSSLVAFSFDDWERIPPNASVSEGLVSGLVALLGWALGLLLLRGWLGWKRPGPIVVVRYYCPRCAASLPAIGGESIQCPLCGAALVAPEGVPVPIARDTVLRIIGAQLSLASALLALDILLLVLYGLRVL